MKFGIEFEMALYWTNRYFYNEFVKRCKKRGWDVNYDGSIRTDLREWGKRYIGCETHEMKTIPYSKINKFLEDLDYIFNDHVKINSNTDKGLRIDFNKSTGTHIHFSNIEPDDYMHNTPENIYFSNRKSIDLIKAFINDNCKYKTIKKDFYRERYSCDIWTNNSRYSAINTSNRRNLGTIEFRLFNLHGIKNRSFKISLIHQISLMVESILYTYNELSKTIRPSYINKSEWLNVYKHNNRLLNDALENNIKIKKENYLLNPNIIKKLRIRKAKEV